MRLSLCDRRLNERPIRSRPLPASPVPTQPAHSAVHHLYHPHYQSPTTHDISTTRDPPLPPSAELRLDHGSKHTRAGQPLRSLLSQKAKTFPIIAPKPVHPAITTAPITALGQQARDHLHNLRLRLSQAEISANKQKLPQRCCSRELLQIADHNRIGISSSWIWRGRMALKALGGAS